MLMLAVASACGVSSGAPAGSPSAAAAVAPGGSPTLDPEVAMPAGFPADVPIYPGARLTMAAGFSAGGATTWGMEWETLDGIDKVRTFYAAKLSQGDWTIEFSGSTPAEFSAVFTRRSNSKAAGILGADAGSGVTKISLSLANG